MNDVDRARFRSLRALAAAVLTIALVSVASPALAATKVDGVDPGAAAAAFSGGKHVYVYPGSTQLLDGTTEAKLESSLAGSRVYVSLLESPRLARAQAKPVSDAIAVAAHRGGKASLVLLGVEAGTGVTFLQVSSSVNAFVYGPQLRAAIRAHHGHPGAEAQALALALVGDKPAPQKTDNSVIVIVLVLVLLLLALAVWRVQRNRSRQRRADARGGKGAAES